MTVKEIRDYGVMVEFAQGGEALLHKTQISHVPHKNVSESKKDGGGGGGEEGEKGSVHFQ